MLLVSLLPGIFYLSEDPYLAKGHGRQPKNHHPSSFNLLGGCQWTKLELPAFHGRLDEGILPIILLSSKAPIQEIDSPRFSDLRSESW